MRLLIPLLLVATALAGCAEPDPSLEPPQDQIHMYRIAYDGSDVYVEGVDHGWLATFRNDGDHAMFIALDLLAKADGRIVTYGQIGGQYAAIQARELQTVTAPSFSTLVGPGEQTLVGTEVNSYEGNDTNFTTGWLLRVYDGATEELVRTETIQWDVQRLPASTPVQGNDKVRTITAGMWLNGTSFYTNIADLLQDPEFPGAPGWVGPDNATDPLPVYVYEGSSSEQPYGNADNCYFTTIEGYNELLHGQADGSTDIRLLRPEEAYTMDGRENDPLYGDALVFINTVVAHDGQAGPEEDAPDPDGPCYDPLRPCDDATGATLQDRCPREDDLP